MAIISVYNFRLGMFVFHCFSNIWLIYMYGLKSFFLYMSYFSILFNNFYFLVGTMDVAKKSNYSSRIFKILFAITVPMGWIVTVLYWLHVYQYAVRPDTPISHNLTSILGHILNLVVLLMDIWIHPTNIKVSYVIYPLVVYVLYEAFLCIKVDFYQHSFPYNFLQLRYVTDEKRLMWFDITVFNITLNVVVVFFFWLSKCLSDWRIKQLFKTREALKSQNQSLQHSIMKSSNSFLLRDDEVKINIPIS
ncbi:hypothetical protein BC833DRAFT_592369 [Globomyces pollinis-pini]|nr:hypothetical protein BC833DRAFT_592369 [Globomyces pollinis-pini]